MKMVDDDGAVVLVPARFARIVWWLLTEAARQFEDGDRVGRVIIHIGQKGTPPKAVLEMHHNMP